MGFIKIVKILSFFQAAAAVYVFWLQYKFMLSYTLYLTHSEFPVLTSSFDQPSLPSSQNRIYIPAGPPPPFSKVHTIYQILKEKIFDFKKKLHILCNPMKIIFRPPPVLPSNLLETHRFYSVCIRQQEARTGEMTIYALG